MVSQGFFSGSADRKKRMAGSSDTKVALGGDNLGTIGAIGGAIGIFTGGVNMMKDAVKKGNEMRENIQSLEIVLANGECINTNTKAKKSAAGYDLTSLFIGAEGTLGLIT